MSIENYRVLFEEYCERHYIKDFKKKYAKRWVVTREALVKEFTHIDRLVDNGRTNPPIHRSPDNVEWIIKHEFAIAGLGESRKASGRRIILYVNHQERIVRVLLAYHKDHLGKKTSETGEWQRIIKSQYAELLQNFNL
jgi:hypothetical protein